MPRAESPTAPVRDIIWPSTTPLHEIRFNELTRGRATPVYQGVFSQMSMPLEKPSPITESAQEQLLDFRRSVERLYASTRNSEASLVDRSSDFRRDRDRLFHHHPQSALSDEQKAHFKGLSYYDYDSAWRFELPVDADVEPEVIEMQLQDDGMLRMRRFGRVHFRAAGQNVSLSLFWLMGYGGGVFLPFRDLTNGSTTYGGGRYLLDTIKNADLGHEGHCLVVDFNYAYNPSCAYNARWHCPLAPEENRLPLAIPAGEQRYFDVV